MQLRLKPQRRLRALVLNTFGFQNGQNMFLMWSSFRRDSEPPQRCRRAGVRVPNPGVLVGRCGAEHRQSVSRSYRGRSPQIHPENVAVQFDKDVWLNLHQEVDYEMDWYTFSCKEAALDVSDFHMHVPKESQLFAQVSVGSSSALAIDVLLNNWDQELPNNGEAC